MGRHSAPDDDADADVHVASTVVVEGAQRGRHSRSEDEEGEPGGATDTAVLPVPLADQETERLSPPEAGTAPGPDSEPTVEVAPEPPPKLVTEPSVQRRAPRIGKGNQSTAADLELLRTRSDVRARVIAAVVAPFVIYTIVMYLVDKLDVYFIWVWLPLVAAGVLAGSILDAAHRKTKPDADPG